MSNFAIKPQITKEFILANVSQEAIFEYYLKVPVQTKQHFVSPLREDTHPTCSFRWFGQWLYFRDWSEEKPKNCFTLVMEIYNCDYFAALEFIYRDMIEGLGTYTIPQKTQIVRTNQQIKNGKKKIQVKVIPHTKQNSLYMSSFGITKKTLKHFHCYSVSHVWVDGKLIWTTNDLDPCIAYYFGKTKQGDQRWKIYFYKRRTFRFIGNTNRINGWMNLPEKADCLVITKSMKDVMVLHTLGICSIAMQNEVTIPYDYIIDECKQRFGKIVSFYDFDYTGVVNANKLKKLYSIPYIFLTNGKLKTEDYGSKDISDYVQSKGIQAAVSFLESHGIVTRL